MKCVSCQSEIPDGSRFCGICGARQDVPAPAPAPAADPSATTHPQGDDMAATLIQAPRLILPVPAPSAPMSAPAAPQSPAAALVAQLGAARPAPASAAAPASSPEPAPAPVPVVLAEVQGAVIAHVQEQTPSIIVDEALGAQTTDGGIAALTKAAEPAAAAPAPAAEAPKPAAEAPKPAAEAPKPAAEAPKPAAGAKVGGEGQFRETIWFMDAIDPEKLAASEEADIEVRQKELAEASKQSVDAEVRQQYSLTSGGGRKPTADAVDAVKRAAAEEQAAAATGGKSNIVLVVAIIVVLVIAAALAFK